MPSGPSPIPGDGRGAWRGLRRRVARLAGAPLPAGSALATSALAGGLSSLAERLQE